MSDITKEYRRLINFIHESPLHSDVNYSSFLYEAANELWSRMTNAEKKSLDNKTTEQRGGHK